MARVLFGVIGSRNRELSFKYLLTVLSFRLVRHRTLWTGYGWIFD